MQTLLSGLCSMTLAVCLMSVLPVAAASGTWTGGSGNWWDSANWQGGTIADGANELATFAPTSTISVQVDSRTLGHIRNQGSARVELYGSGPLTLQGASQPTITNVTFGVLIGAPLAGTQGFAKWGAGNVILVSNPVHTLSGPIIARHGQVVLRAAGATMPAVSEIMATNSETAISLQAMGAGDPMSVYPPTLRISGAGTSAANGNYNGALYTVGNGVNAAVSNVIVDTVNHVAPHALFTRIGQATGSGSLRFHGAISGAGDVQYFVHQGTKSFDFHGSNTYSGATHIFMNSGDATGIFNVIGPQRWPYTNLNVMVNVGDVILNLNNNLQRLTRLDLWNNNTVGGSLIVRGTTGGTLQLDGDQPPPPAVPVGFYPYDPTRFIIESGSVFAPYYIVNRGGNEIIVSGGVLQVNAEILQGSDSAGTVTVANAGSIDCYVYRAAWNASGTLNLMPGGTFRTTTIWCGGGSQPGIINFNGGVLSDGAYGDWNDSYTNWFKDTLQLNILAGGALIEVNSPHGRGIWKTFTGSGGLVKLGPGALYLIASNSYNGATIVSNGILALVHPEALPASSKVLEIVAGAACSVMALPNHELSLAGGQTVGGEGTIIGSLQLGNDATLSPGASIGALTVTSNVSFQAGARYVWEIGSGGAADVLVCEGALALPAAANACTVQVAVASPPSEDGTYLIASAGAGISGSPDAFFMDYSATGIEGPEHPSIDGSSLVVQLVIPEPAAFVGLAIVLIVRRCAKYDF